MSLAAVSASRQPASTPLSSPNSAITPSPAISILVNPNVSDTAEAKENIQTAARQIGRQIFIVTAGKEAEIDAAFATLAERHAGGLVVQGDIFYTNRRDDLIALTTPISVFASMVGSRRRIFGATARFSATY
jgi:DNA-binding LacI/PurR family transcriptional regulator